MIKQLIILRVCLNIAATNAFAELERWTENRLNIENRVNIIKEMSVNKLLSLITCMIWKM
jgi:hypothetical protein